MSIYYSIRDYIAEHPETMGTWEEEARKRQFLTIPSQEELAREYEAVTGQEYRTPEAKEREVYKPDIPLWAHRIIKEREHFREEAKPNYGTPEEYPDHIGYLPTTMKGLAVSVSDSMDFISTAEDMGDIPLSRAYWHQLKWLVDTLAEWEI